jgi:hypothetical protein
MTPVGTRGAVLDWARMLAYVTGAVDQELLVRNEYLTAENRILTAQLNGRLKLSDAERSRSRAVRPMPRAIGRAPALLSSRGRMKRRSDGFFDQTGAWWFGCSPMSLPCSITGWSSRTIFRRRDRMRSAG